MARQTNIQRLRLTARGLVQGVGFRPFVHRLAGELGLAGSVRNDVLGAVIEVEGPSDRLVEFGDRLRAELPAPGYIDRLEQTQLTVGGQSGFAIVASTSAGQAEAWVLPDLALCDDCRRELLDPRDRRHGYPFLNCTHCGPRFTIIRNLPYDRANTTMAGFALCDDCRREYEDPVDRRFHAQPTACDVCGPRLDLFVVAASAEGPYRSAVDSARAGTPSSSLASAGGEAAGRAAGATIGNGGPADHGQAGAWRSGPGGAELQPQCHPADAGTTSEQLAAVAALLRDGGIVAIKGLGGYHLAVDARSETAVSRLRQRKHREAKPLAVMVAGLAEARCLAEVSEAEAELLTSPAAPIVLLTPRADHGLAAAVAPGQATIGVMLAYTPLHALLLAAAGGPLVMTSGNLTDEPIAHDDDDAARRLDGVADLRLSHNRPIQRRCDDSVARVWRDRLLLYRRSRGYAPAPMALDDEGQATVLAVGSHQKNTFCLTRGRDAFLSHHIGDLENDLALTAFETGIADFERLFRLAPTVLAHDLHPDYWATRYALERAEREGQRLVAVQHHHAHLAACLADNGRHDRVLGVCYDGTGLGRDDTVWGGEILLGDRRDFDRVGCLRPFVLPGGDAAVRQGWRVALGLAGQCGLDLSAEEWGVPGERLAQVGSLLASGVGCVPTTSAGRLFDAVAALAGVTPVSRYEGEAAVLLEGCAVASDDLLPFDLDDDGQIDWRPAVARLVERRRAGASAGELAGAFHRGLAEATAMGCARQAERAGVRAVALSGGCFQNVMLLAEVADRLHNRGFEVLTHRRVPPNDGGLSLGQAAVARAVLAAE